MAAGVRGKEVKGQECGMREGGGGRGQWSEE